MSPAPNFEPGELVTLKSGGPVMSVKSVGETSYEGPGVWCIWFEKVGNKQEVKEHTFAPVVLIKYAPPPIPTRRTLDRGIV